MYKLVKKQREVISYFFVALFGVIVQLIVSPIAQKVLHFSYRNSVALGYGVAMISGFFLTKVFTFKENEGRTRRQLVKYLFIATIAGFITTYGAVLTKMLLENMVAQKTIVLRVASYSINIIGFVSHLAGMGFSFIFNFFGHKHFTFKRTGVYQKMSTKIFK